MKRLFKLALVAAAGSMMISCGGLLDKIDDLEDEQQYEAYEKETDEISEGKLFQIKAATVEYSDGTVFAFDNYGKDGYVKTTDNVMMLVKDGFSYVANLDNKTYVKMEGSEFSIALTFTFQEESFRFMHNSFAGLYYADLKESTKTVAGKKCVDFVYTVEGSSVEVAGWKRILLFRGDSASSEALEAVSIKESATLALPDGLTEIKY